MIQTRHFQHLRCSKAILDIQEAIDMAAGYRRAEGEKRDFARLERRSKGRGAGRWAADLDASANRIALIALIADELERAFTATDRSKETTR